VVKKGLSTVAHFEIILM